MGSRANPGTEDIRTSTFKDVARHFRNVLLHPWPKHLPPVALVVLDEEVLHDFQWAPNAEPLRGALLHQSVHRIR